eukprot:4379048-Pyramimonas_sp.AAC.1
MRPRSTVLGGGDACGRSHWDLRWGWATKRCIGCAGRMRAVRLGPSVGLTKGPRKAVLSVRGACGRSHWGRRWSCLLGHEALYSVVRDACGRSDWGRRWSSLWAHESPHW